LGVFVISAIHCIAEITKTPKIPLAEQILKIFDGGGVMKNVMLVTMVLAFVVAISGCSSSTTTTVPTLAPTALPKNVSLKIFAPSTFTDAAKGITAAYEAANPGVKLAIEFGHSPTQRLQFTQGALGDVFITASQKDMTDAVTDQTVASGQPKIFATNQLVVILPPNNPANLQKLDDLAKPGVRLLVAVVDTPIGKVTLEILDKMDKQFGSGYKAKVLANVVSNESGVKPIVSKIKLGEADAGIVYVTDTVSAPDLKTISIPSELNTIMQLNVAPIIKAANPEQAASFTAFLMSSEGQAILKKWGFLPGKP
jgi:molybdate transport system substrate-binding protein